MFNKYDNEQKFKDSLELAKKLEKEKVKMAFPSQTIYLKK